MEHGHAVFGLPSGKRFVIFKGSGFRALRLIDSQLQKYPYATSALYALEFPRRRLVSRIETAAHSEGIAPARKIC